MKLTRQHEELLGILRQYEGKPPSPKDATLAFKLGVTERQVITMLADLSDAGRIRINRQGGGRSIEVYPDKRDDSDDISRAIRLGVTIDKLDTAPVSIPQHRPSPSEKSQTSAGYIAPSKPKSPKPAPPKNAGKSHKWPEPIGRMPTPANCSPGELQIDDSYQRSIDTGPSRALIRRIASGWDWRMCLPLVVSKRKDDTLFVIDGQHRLAAAKMRGDIPWLPCCICEFGSIEDEAAMFVAMNRQRRAMNRLDEFHAAQAGNDASALAVTAIVEGAGFTVSRKTGSAAWAPGEVAFTSAIANVYNKHGDAIPRRALAMMAGAFPQQRLTAGSSIFTAICRLMIAPPEGFDPATLERGLRKFDMPGWASFLAGMKGGTVRAQALREMLIEACADVAKEIAA